ncbi:hypothetical protein HHI36_004436 [Cryptolaemus montrouzieri]|uniref:Protein hunchback n=1 Tax=Cryptolaemus montrouzieri TaxID=559131 RepID=A0ABD2NRV7_9CUCU
MKDFFEMTSTCIQGGYPRALGGYQIPNQQIGPHSPPAGWQYPPGIQNQTSSSEDRNDSGINSASDCHSSSPGSENGVEGFQSPDVKGRQSQLAYYSTPIYQRASIHSSNSVMLPRHPMYPQSPNQAPQIDANGEVEDFEDKEGDSTLTMPSSPVATDDHDALKRLEMSVERVNYPSTSPGISENSMDDTDKRSENTPEEFDENGHHVPRMNSHGKIKTFKCKQCSFVAITKADFWDHQKIHIKPEKLLTCHKCPFVTEYKHHLEYHLRNHNGSKPFKCEHCDYTCVNKSMLNSHKKSHSNIYQYRCKNCHYASKYCHSLKLHLRKYGHEPAMVLNPDGSPNPLPIIDVYGTRRGPKVKPIHDDEDQPNLKKMKSENAVAPPVLPLPLQQLMSHAPPMQMPLAYSWIQQAMIYQNLERLARGGLSPVNEDLSMKTAEPSDVPMPTDSSGALDLTKEKEYDGENPASKLETPSTSSDEEEDHTTVFPNVEVVQNDEPRPEDERTKPKTVEERNYNCQYCDISFGDAVLYTMHMGYHGYQHPFTCNMCGEKCNDKVSFFLHIARTSHS